MAGGHGEALLEIVKLNTACQFRFAKLLQKGFKSMVLCRKFYVKRYYFKKLAAACGREATHNQKRVALFRQRQFFSNLMIALMKKRQLRLRGLYLAKK